MDLTYTEWRKFRKSQKRIEAKLDAILINQGTLMNTIAEIRQDLADTKAVVQQLVGFIQNNDAEKAALKQQIADLVAAANLAQAEKDALQAQIDAAFQEAEDLENEARKGLPGVPPVGGTPLGQSYVDNAAFMAAVTAYTGDEQVMLDGIEVKAAANGSTAVLSYFTHSADGHIDTTGPTD